RRFFPFALLLAAAPLFLGVQALLLLLARAALGLLASLNLDLGSLLLLLVLLADAILLEVHQLLPREEDRAFLLFSHGIGAPSKSLGYSDPALLGGAFARISVACPGHGAKPYLASAANHQKPGIITRRGLWPAFELSGDCEEDGAFVDGLS